jgi:hypothetical protein
VTPGLSHQVRKTQSGVTGAADGRAGDKPADRRNRRSFSVPRYRTSTSNSYPPQPLVSFVRLLGHW